MKRHNAVVDLRRDWLQLRQCLDAALHLSRLARLRLEAVDESLQVPALLILLLHQLQFEPLLFAPRFLKAVIAAGVERQPALIEMQDRADGAVQKIAVVADDQHGMRIRPQVVLQP
jgi:hypothetical protein